MPGVMSQQECVEGREALDVAQPEKFTEEQQARLARLRRAIVRGERSDRYPVDKRQDFIRWLIDQGKLSEN
jgi:hypothetical protein